MMQLAPVHRDDTSARPRAIQIRPPRREDGPAVWRLIRECESLDDNSLYCNLLQCTHFADTCAVAEAEGDILGWMSGYIPPHAPDTLFVWQIGVSPRARGRGFARRLVGDVLARGICAEVRHIQCTITADNAASWALFGSIADALEADMARHAHFRRDKEFGGTHDTEFLVTIGPFSRDDLGLRPAA
jgi:L-2,4-diaminobutyric acid acetyltransferase